MAVRSRRLFRSLGTTVTSVGASLFFVPEDRTMLLKRVSMFVVTAPADGFLALEVRQSGDVNAVPIQTWQGIAAGDLLVYAPPSWDAAREFDEVLLATIFPNIAFVTAYGSGALLLGDPS